MTIADPNHYSAIVHNLPESEGSWFGQQKFSEIFGKSIIAAITECRLEEVARRLTISNMPVGKVAAMCGFRDVAYLGKIFRQRFGKTMTEFRTS